MAGARFFLGVGAALAFASSNAMADPSAADRETSRDLYAQGVKALADADYHAAERACGGAFKLVNAPTGAVCWARALEGLGKLLEARDAYLSAAHFSQKPDEPEVFTSARSDGQAGADRLAKRIATLVLAVVGVSDSAPLRVAIDGVEITADTARLPRKVNPGPHVVLVASRGYRTVRIDVNATEGEERQVDVQLRPESAGDPAKQDAGVGHTRSHGPSQPTYVALGVGVVGVAVGSVFGVLALSKKSSLDGGACSAGKSECDPGAEGQINSMHTDAIVSDVSLGIGILGVAVGTYLLLTSGSGTDATPAAVRISPSIGLGRTGFAWTFR